MLANREEYHNLVENLQYESLKDQRRILRDLALNDLYFMCWFILDWDFYDCDYAFNFCRLVEQEPWQLWLVARGHLKSLTLTTAHNIQLVLNDPEETIAIISYNNPTATKFLRQIKFELEGNSLLKDLFPEILYKDPAKESPKWSEEGGLLVKRKSNRKETTFTAFGLVDSMKTGDHYSVHSFDDAVTEKSVTTPEMIMKTTDAWKLSDNLGMSGEGVSTRKKYAGTRYHFQDTYSVMIEKGQKHTIITATDNGEMDGNPIFLSKQQLFDKKKEQGSYIFSCQMLLKPVSREDQKLKPEHMQYYTELPKVNYFIAVDPANEKKKGSDYTAIIVFGYSADRGVYIVDAVHDKLDLNERYKTLKRLNDRYRPLRIGYEQYGMQTDISFFRMENERLKYKMPIIKIKGSMSKEDRIKRLVALLEQKRIFAPKSLRYFSKFAKQEVDIVSQLLFEMDKFPFGNHDDLLDVLSRMFDVFLNNPSEKPQREVKPEEKYKTSNVFERVMSQQQKKSTETAW